jgi:integrase
MSEPSELWINLLPKRTDEQKPTRKRHDYCKQVLDLLSEKHPDLHTGKIGAILTPEDAQSLVDAFQRNTPGHIFKHQVDFLIRGLEKGTLELGWNVAIPEPPLVIPRDKPRLTIDSFAALPEVYNVESAFLEDLKQPPPATRTSRIGQLLLSAILCGGLVRKRWLAPWVAALPEAICEDSQLWLNMVYSSSQLERELKKARQTGKIAKDKKTKPDHSGLKEEYEIHQRWFADPLTHGLILRWHKEFPEDTSAGRDVSALPAIRQYLDSILDKEFKTSESFVLSLMHGCATRLGFRVQPFLMSYAEGNNKSVSLSMAAWERLVTGKIIITPGDDANETNGVIWPVSESLAIHSTKKIAPLADQEKMLKEVLNIINPPTTTWKRKGSDARESLRAYHEENNWKMCESLSLLILWCIDLLTHFNNKDLLRGRVKSSLRASSVRRYLVAIGKRLITVAKRTELTRLESDELHDIYRDVIDICPTKKSKNKAGTRLNAFHQFLMVRLGVPQVDFSDLGVRSGPAESAVNANMFSFDSFDHLKKALCPNYQAASRIRKIQYLVAIIAFRTGLREMEILKLRIVDLQGHIEPELLVRTNRYGYVKSSASIRRLPLACLLEEDELELLLAWRRDRLHEDRGTIPQSLLFCMASTPNSLLPIHEVIPTIVTALRQVTGDASLVFHHFRHSFATLLLLRLLKNFPPEVRQRFHFLGHQLFDHSNCDRLRKSLLGNHRLGRQALFGTAQICGHSSPEVTLLHYFHLCDWLLGLELAALDNQPKLDVTTIKAITGLPQHILYYDKNKQKDASWHMSLFLEKLPIPNKLKPGCELHRVDTRLIPEKRPDHPNSQISLWRRVITVIRERQMGRLPFDTLAARSGFAVNDVRSWCNNVELLATMKTKRGKPRHLNGSTHRKNPDLRFPSMLHEKESRNIAEIVLNVFETRGGRKKQDIIMGVRDYIACFSVGESGVPCQTHGNVKKWIRFLSSLNVPLQQIHVVRIQPRTAKIEPETVGKKLAVNYGLPESSITVRRLYPAEYSRGGAYCVQVKNSKVDKNGKLNGNYGFRFAMYMIAIITGLE